MIARQFSARACGFMSQPLRTNRGLLLYEYLQARVFLVMEYCNGGDLHDASEQPTAGCLLIGFDDDSATTVPAYVLTAHI